uniref:MOB kinase activator 1B n=1 Tax=Capra hircus TaxID=9925 RepID=A0A8C2RM69_CAPHI
AAWSALPPPTTSNGVDLPRPAGQPPRTGGRGPLLPRCPERWGLGNRSWRGRVGAHRSRESSRGLAAAVPRPRDRRARSPSRGQHELLVISRESNVKAALQELNTNIFPSSRKLACKAAISGWSGSRSSKTFKPKKNIPEGSHQYELLKHAEATLGSGNLRMAVMLPEGEDLNEWVAVNTVDFFNQINMLYGTITDFCTEESCPVMSAGPKYEYHWADGTNIKKPIKCSAPKYIDYLMTWVQDQLDDETLFPSKIGIIVLVNWDPS